MAEDVNKLLSRAKIGMLQQPDAVFISTICFSLKTVITTDVPTAATNGKLLLINPDYFTKLTLQERVGLLSHEALHVAYKHMLRLETKDIKKWNVACDYVINGFLIDRGFTLPKGGLFNRSFAGMSSEQVYAKISNSHVPKDFEPDLKSPDGDPVEAEVEVQQIVQRAAMQARMSGNSANAIPSEIQRQLDDMLKPKVDWRKALANFLKNMSKEDFSYRKFNRRYLQDNLYFPTRYSEGNLSRVDFAVDVSGSVTDKICNQFCSEIHSVMQAYSPHEIGVIQWDHRVQKIDTVRGLQGLLTLKFVGGGGTCINPVMQAFKQDKKAKALIVLTDGFLSESTHQIIKADKRPVIWCIYDNPHFEAPYGKVIHFKFQNQ